MIIKSCGFISPNMIRSKNALNFAYIVYLKLKDQGYPPSDIETYVRKWFVYSLLTRRYSGSPESLFDFDIRRIASRPFTEYLNENEEANLSDAFWNASLIQSLDTSVSSSPYFNLYLAAQTKANDKGFLSTDITVAQMIEYRGDIHHIFPRNYLKKHGFSRGRYNQIANYVMMQSEINIQIGDKKPADYFELLKQQCIGGTKSFGGIFELDELYANLRSHCIPLEIFDMEISDYDEFLIKRRELMASKLREYYHSL
jgi:Uncharacterized conserved protein